MINLKNIRTGLVLAGILTTAACATTMSPNELVAARNNYARAAQGPAVQFAPADLDTAKKSLDRAEAAFKEEGDTAETKDIAYAAARSAEIAESRGRIVAANQVKDQTNVSQRANEVNQAQVYLRGAREDQGPARDAGAGARDREGAPGRGRAPRRAGGRRSREVRVGEAGPGSRHGHHSLGRRPLRVCEVQLLPAAQTKLNDVAEALTKQDVDSTIVVEGHTDSQGTAASNQELSQKRAESVRTYLVSRGIAADRITAAGFGPTRSIADNASPEGRANNRRVEIVVKPKN